MISNATRTLTRDRGRASYILAQQSRPFIFGTEATSLFRYIVGHVVAEGRGSARIALRQPSSFVGVISRGISKEYLIKLTAYFA